MDVVLRRTRRLACSTRGREKKECGSMADTREVTT